MKKVISIINAHKTFTVFLAFFLGTGTALATGGATADFSPVFTEIMALLEGDVGRIITACAVGWGFIKILQQDWVQVIGSFLGALLLINLEDILDSLFTAAIAIPV
ncbi:MAG: hypothetical protein ACI9T7_000015 [Oleiphilaceae bacterium]|jgi:hypothetical protein